MRKTKKCMICLLLLTLIFGTVGLLGQKRMMRDNLIRLHVVANSDSEWDQQLKLEVRDAVLASLENVLKDVKDPLRAEQRILENLPKIRQTSRETLETLGCGEKVEVSLEESYFGTRHYDTFSLPAGIYKSLRITIGDGAGKNWWCVVYPSFCTPESGEEFSQMAVQAGFSESLAGALEKQERVEIRFFLLDLLGKLEGFWTRD